MVHKGPPALFPDDEDFIDEPEQMLGADPASLSLYDVATGQHELLAPFMGTRTSMQVCTAPFDAHARMESIRTLVAFHTLGRYLRGLGFSLDVSQMGEIGKGPEATCFHDQMETFGISLAPTDSIVESDTTIHAMASKADPPSTPARMKLQCGHVEEEAPTDIRKLLETHTTETVRFGILDRHYRATLECSPNAWDNAHQKLAHLYRALDRINRVLADTASIPDRGEFVQPARSVLDGFVSNFHQALCADFDTPAALARLTTLARAANELTKSNRRPSSQVAYTLAACRSAMVQTGAALGLLQAFPADAMINLRDCRAQALGLDGDRIEAIIHERGEARRTRDFERADTLRAELSVLGIEIMDGPDGTEWAVVPTPSEVNA